MEETAEPLLFNVIPIENDTEAKIVAHIGYVNENGEVEMNTIEDISNNRSVCLLLSSNEMCDQKINLLDSSSKI